MHIKSYLCAYFKVTFLEKKRMKMLLTKAIKLVYILEKFMEFFIYIC